MTDEVKRPTIAELEAILNEPDKKVRINPNGTVTVLDDDGQPIPAPTAFNNGLSREQEDVLDDLMIDLGRIAGRIEELDRHRSYSLAITKIEEAKHWLRDRKHKPA